MKMLAHAPGLLKSVMKPILLILFILFICSECAKGAHDMTYRRVTILGHPERDILLVGESGGLQQRVETHGHCFAFHYSQPSRLEPIIFFAVPDIKKRSYIQHTDAVRLAEALISD